MLEKEEMHSETGKKEKEKHLSIENFAAPQNPPK